MKKHWKSLTVFLLIAVILSGVPAGAYGEELSVRDGGKKTVERISGKNRVETSIEVSKKAYPQGVDTLFLAGYSGDADALTATFLAGQKKGPLLLADKDKLSQELIGEIKRLDPKEIILLGGEKAISKNIQGELESKNYITRRIQGKSRTETAVKLAQDYYGDKKLDEVFVVEYSSLVDALAIGPVAAKTAIPVLITGKDTVPKEVEDFLKELDVKKVSIVGGEGTVSKKGREELLKLVDKVERVSGKDRIETSLKIAEKYFTNPSSSFLANGWKNADALIGGYFAGMEDGPIILASEKDLREDAANYISNSNSKTYVLGGKSVINNTRYSLNTLGSPYRDYTLLKEGKGVCNAYALVTSRFLDEINIENIFIGGEANNSSNSGYGGHAWNKLKLDGQWYNIDTTWDDPAGPEGINYLRYKYFLISDEKMNINHRTDQKTPEARDKRYEALGDIGTNPAEYKGSYYYFNNNDNRKIYKMSMADLSSEKISDLRTDSLVVYDDSIYFSHSWLGGTIHSMDLDGNNLQQLNDLYSISLKIEYPYLIYFAGDQETWEKIDLR